MKLYRPVLIESAEQAEALPEGTVLIREDHFAFQKYAGRFVSADPHDLPIAHAWEVVGWTALVPIEAEEELAHLDPWEGVYDPTTREEAEELGPLPAQPLHTRLVTPWEEAQ